MMKIQNIYPYCYTFSDCTNKRINMLPEKRYDFVDKHDANGIEKSHNN